jgi:aryl-alcohol dehydrogenase-like predicted oxidoreductase
MSRILTASSGALTKYGVGTWALGGAYGNLNKYALSEAVDAAIDNGYNAIDTAQGYGFGAAEILLGRIISKKVRKDLFVISKFGIHYPDAGNKPLNRDSSPHRCLESLHQSLRNLGTDYVDGYLVHWPDWVTPLEEVGAALEEIRRRGDARFVGVSNFPLQQLEKLHKFVKLDLVQYPYSIVDRRIEKIGIADFCKKNQIMITSYGSLGFGALLIKESNWRSDDWRRLRPNHFGLGLFESDKFERVRSLNLDIQMVKSWLYSQTVSDLCFIGFQEKHEVSAFSTTNAGQVSNEETEEKLLKAGLSSMPDSWVDEWTNYKVPEN